jgi:hypothetical protein
MRSLHRIVATVVILAAVALLPYSPARADYNRAYAAVVCKGNRSLIRFTFAEDEDPPEFTRPGSSNAQQWGGPLMISKPTDTELDQLVPDNPSRCRLQDGREILLRQGDLDDVAAYGTCGSDATEIFSLWIGGRKIYSREIWHPKCGFPSEITEILVDGDHLTECRSAHKDELANAQPATCTDRSERLSNPIHDNADDGKVVLVRFAPDREAFCRSLIRPWAPTPGAPRVNWPTYSHDGLETVEYPESSQLDDMDLDNAGKTSRVASWEDGSGGPNGDESLWAVLPDNASKSDVQSVQKKLARADEGTVDALRQLGIIVFAGDQTLYRSVGGVHLVPFVRDGTTWMHASHVNYSRAGSNPTDVILRPTPNGELKEICVFHANPPL